MELELATIADWIASAAWPLGRVAGLVMTAPIFTATAVPMRIRAALVVLLTVILLPLAPLLASTLLGQHITTLQLGQFLFEVHAKQDYRSYPLSAFSCLQNKSCRLTADS